ncbi:hypothetical protein N9L68_04760 [bacterium]|nr:hypothetical protein [bacterium]
MPLDSVYSNQLLLAKLRYGILSHAQFDDPPIRLRRSVVPSGAILLFGGMRRAGAGGGSWSTARHRRSVKRSTCSASTALLKYNGVCQCGRIIPPATSLVTPTRASRQDEKAELRRQICAFQSDRDSRSSLRHRRRRGAVRADRPAPATPRRSGSSCQVASRLGNVAEAAPRRAASDFDV